MPNGSQLRAPRADRGARSYDHIMNTDNMTTNKQNAAKYASFEEAEDDFM